MSAYSQPFLSAHVDKLRRPCWMGGFFTQEGSAEEDGRRSAVGRVHPPRLPGSLMGFWGELGWILSVRASGAVLVCFRVMNEFGGIGRR